MKKLILAGIIIAFAQSSFALRQMPLSVRRKQKNFFTNNRLTEKEKRAAAMRELEVKMDAEYAQYVRDLRRLLRRNEIMLAYAFKRQQ